MINPQDLDVLFLKTINGDVRQGRKQKLTRSFLAPSATKMRLLPQRLNRCIYLANGRVPMSRPYNVDDFL